MQIRTPLLSGNQRQALSLPENCHPVVTKGEEREGTEERDQAHVEYPHPPLEEAVHLVISFINVSLSFSPFFSFSFFSLYFKGKTEGNK